MKVIHLNHSDISGGAARAAYRIHHALLSNGVESRMRVSVATAGDWTVDGPRSKAAKLLIKLRPMVSDLLNKSLKTGNPIIHSTGILPSRLRTELNTSDADVLHLHWINAEMLSVADIGKLKKPVVWTLHDMWAFCGAEHINEDTRWSDGYNTTNRPAHEAGFDLNRWTFRRKLKHWKRPMHIVTPSRWLADCARQSVLMREWPVTVIANTLDTDRWEPINKTMARALLGLPLDVPLLLFGAIGGARDPHKGFDLLLEALSHLRGQLIGLELVVFGQLAPKAPPDIGFPIHYAGHLHDDVSLRLLYSSADMLVIPSRVDNLPNTGVEAHACGTPVVAFNTCGLPDIVAHQKTGYLAKSFDTSDLAAGIQWVLGDAERMTNLGKAARARAVELWSGEMAAQQYQTVYRAAVGRV